MTTFEFREIKNGEYFDSSSLCDGVSFTQADFYGDWQKKVGFETKKFLALNGQEIVAYFQITSYPLLGDKRYLYIPYGPVTKEFSKDFLNALKKELTRLAKTENAVFVRLDFTPTAPNEILSEFFAKAPLYTYRSARFQPRAEWFLGLKKTEEELLKAMHEKTRYSIRLAERKGVVAEIITGEFEQHFETFYELISATAKRNKFGVHQKNYYANIFRDLSKIKNSYLSVASYNQKILAIDVIIVCGKIANYVFGGSSDEKRNLMPTYLAQWKAICRAKQLNCAAYNFGGVSPGNATSKEWKGWDGLTIFKKKFGGYEVKHSDFFDVVIKPFWYHLYKLIKYIRL